MIARLSAKLIAVCMLLTVNPCLAQDPDAGGRPAGGRGGQVGGPPPGPPPVGAQPPGGKNPAPRPGSRPGGQDDEARNQFFEAMRDAHRRQIPDREIVDLLRHEVIRKEVGLSDESWEKIQELLRSSMKATWDLRKEVADDSATKEELVEKILARQATFDQQILALLRDPENLQYERFLGIYVQAREFRAATNEDVANRIGLVGDDLQAYRAARFEIARKLMDDNRDRLGSLLREGQREDISKLFDETEVKLNQALAMKLNSDQRKALENLKGAAFKLPPRPFDFRGPPRGGGRPESRERGKDNCGEPPSVFHASKQ